MPAATHHQSPPVTPDLIARIRTALSSATDTDLQNHSPGAPGQQLQRWLTLASIQPETRQTALFMRAAIALRLHQPHRAALDLLNVLSRTRQSEDILPLLIKAARDAGEAEAADLIARQLPVKDPGQLDFTRKVNIHDLRAFIESKRARTSKTKAADIPPLPPLTNPEHDPATQPVDVIIPVYRGHQATLDCLHSLLDARAANGTAHELIVLDDASPEPELIDAIAQLAERGHLTLIRHPVNLGYIRGMNRAMARHPDRDIVWLNADTRVQGNWLDRLRTWAYCEPHIASVVPLSNNGELLSFPEPRYPFPMPDAEHHRALDQIAAQWPDSNPIPLEFPCGFCMFVRRAAIVDVGYLDETTLHGGYGEETDWSLRARARGWQHLAALNVFVAHRGSLSFGAEKKRLVARNNDIIKRRYPQAEREFDHILKRDPLRPARQALQRGRMDQQLALHQWMHAASGPEPCLGSTSAHPRQLHILPSPVLSDILSPFFTLPDADTKLQTPPLGLLWLSWQRGSAGLTFTLGAALPGLPLKLEYPQHPLGHAPNSPPDAPINAPIEALIRDLQHLPLQGLVIHDPASTPAALLTLPEKLQQPSAQCQSPAPGTTTAPPPPDARVLLIGDRLDRPEIAHRWLALTRQLATSAQPWQLVLAHPTPWQRELWSTGLVLTLDLPKLPALSPASIAQLAGVQAVVSLDPNSDARRWAAPTLAQRFALPLCAPDSASARALNAHPLPPDLALQHTMPANALAAAANDAPPRLMLNIGSGHDNPSRLPETFRGNDWQQIRLDIDPTVKPDLLCSALDLGAVADQSIDAIYSSHSLEHLESHQVAPALAAMHRVLKPTGFALITLPDLEAIAALIAAGRLTDTAYDSPIGPVTALDMLYGHQGAIAKGNGYMAHRTGFDTNRLGQALLAAGFAEVRVRKGQCYDLWVRATLG